jgi:hypothetical protein
VSAIAATSSFSVMAVVDEMGYTLRIQEGTMFRGVAVALAMAVSCTPLVFAQEPGKSAALARQLTQLMDAKKLDSIAGADSQDLGTYVAALYYPGSELLVVSAKYAAPPLLNEKIGNKDYRDVYIDLNSASVAGSKVLVMDQNADGLVARPSSNQGADNCEIGGKAVMFDGDWKKAKMSQADYTKAFAKAEDAYSRALEILINQLKSTT